MSHLDLGIGLNKQATIDVLIAVNYGILIYNFFSHILAFQPDAYIMLYWKDNVDMWTCMRYRDKC